MDEAPRVLDMPVYRPRPEKPQQPGFLEHGLEGGRHWAEKLSATLRHYERVCDRF